MLKLMLKLKCGIIIAIHLGLQIIWNLAFHHLLTNGSFAVNALLKKEKKFGKLKSLRQPASADFWVFSTSCFKFIQQKVEKFPKK